MGHRPGREKRGGAAGAAQTSAGGAAGETPAPADAPAAAVVGAQAAEGQAAERMAADRAALESRLLRLQADFDNYRRRSQKEREDAALQARVEMLEALLPVIDHFALALKAAEERGGSESLCAGFRMVYDQMLAALGRCGVEAFDAVGQAFDPQRHEAVAHIPSDEPEGRIIAQSRCGFRAGVRLVRPASVVVSSGPAAAAGGGGAEGGV